MSVSCKVYIGYTITLKTDLKEKDFDFFYEREDIDFPDHVELVIDGMCGQYASLIYVDKILDCWMEYDSYFALRGSEVNDEIYEALNKVYKTLYTKDLERERIEYALSFHWY